MCLIIFSWKQNTEYPLVLMANRDEFYQRPTLQASVWKNQPEIVAGKDLQGNGTWMGISKSGKWAALTNYRALSEMRKDAPTRGSLVTDFLVNNYSPEEYLTIVKNDPNNYNGFNLLVGNANGIGYYSNKEGIVKKVETGVHGLSNHLLDTPWPKVQRGKSKLSASLNHPINTESLLNHMTDKTIASDEQLPNTGVSKEWEKLLSPMFIESEQYGTRCSTILLMDKKGKFTFIEKTYPNPFDPVDESTQKFEVEPISAS